MFNIVIKETKEFVREKIYLFFFILFPVILVFLLGNLLNSTDIADEAIGQLKVQYVIDTEDPFSVAAIQSFAESVSDGSHIFFEQTDQPEAARKLAGENKITALVLFTGSPLQVQIYEGTNMIQNRTVEAVLNGFAQNSMTIAAVMKNSPQRMSSLSMTQESYTRQKDLGVNRSMIDYYAVAMVVMIAFMSMMVGAGAFTSEKESKTINRLIMAPQSKVSMFLQKVAGMMPQTLLQVTIIMGASILIFHAHYGATMEANLYLFLMFIVITFCMISIGAVIGLGIKGSPSSIIMPVVWVMLFFGGTYSKELHIKGVSDLLPNYIFQQAAFEVAVFSRYDTANKIIIGCLAVTVLALAAGAFLFNRKEAV